ncbi:MAG: redoxin domain-containing protein [Bacteroidaceae bacterium]|nr:redoxin domain-containing protein [Bacteroidaceae bacterium]
MTKRLLTYLLMALFFISCGEEQGNRARVTGTIKGLGNDTIIIYGADQMFDKVDTIYVQKDKFKRFIPVDTVAQAWMMFKDGLRVPLFLSKRSQIKIKGDTASLADLQIDDKAENHLLMQFKKENDSLLTVAAIDTFITHNPTSPVGFYLINQYLSEANENDRRLMRPLLDKFDEDLKRHPQYINLNLQLTTEVRADTGLQVPYFRVRNLQNRWVSRTDFNRKWLFINFWASWNETSNQRNRTIYKPLYEKIKKEKLENIGMLGISLDIDRQQWKKAVDKDTLAWEQVCDAKGWLTETVNIFNLRYLPANVLITPEGKISAYNLTKEQLEDKLKELKELQEQEKKNKKK